MILKFYLIIRICQKKKFHNFSSHRTGDQNKSLKGENITLITGMGIHFPEQPKYKNNRK